MLAVTIPRFGSAEVLTLTELPDPVPGAQEVLISVAAAGINRSDLVATPGQLSAPEGCVGLARDEVSGTIARLVRRWPAGPSATGVRVVGRRRLRLPRRCPAAHVLPVPDTSPSSIRPALPEVTLPTVWSKVFESAGAACPGERFLVHGGSAASAPWPFNWLEPFGARVAVTASTSREAGRTANGSAPTS